MEFRLEVFYRVVQRQSFTKASEELFISQPAVTRHIHELESQYKCMLFERKGNRRIKLTAAGEKLLGYVMQLATVHREMNFAMSEITNDYTGEIRLGASSTVSQYVLPRQLARFHKKFPNMHISLTAGNSEEVERSLLANDTDIGIVEGAGRLPELKYENYLRDELVLTCKAGHPVTRSGALDLPALLRYIWVMREKGSGTLNVLKEALASKSIKLSDLDIAMELGSTESIKGYLQESECLAFLSVHAVGSELKHGDLQTVEIDGFNVERVFRFIEPQGYSSPNTMLLKRYLKGAASPL